MKHLLSLYDCSTEEIEKNCNGQSNGMSCSEYYLRGGKF